MRGPIQNESDSEASDTPNPSSGSKRSLYAVLAIAGCLAIGFAIYAGINWTGNEQDTPQAKQSDVPAVNQEVQKPIDYEAIFAKGDFTDKKKEEMEATLAELAVNPPQDTKLKLVLGHLLVPLVHYPDLSGKVIPVLEKIAMIEHADEICQIIEKYPDQNTGLVNWIVATRSKRHLMSLINLRGSENRQNVLKALVEFRIKGKEIVKQCIKDARESDRDSIKCAIALSHLQNYQVEEVIELKDEILDVFVKRKLEIDGWDVRYLKDIVDDGNVHKLLRPDLLENNKELCQLVGQIKADEVREFMVIHHFQDSIPHFHNSIMGSPDCEKFVWRYLKDSNQATRVYAVEILKEIGTVKSLPKLSALKDASKDDVIVMPSLELAITEIRARNPIDVVQRDPQ